MVVDIISALKHFLFYFIISLFFVAAHILRFLRVRPASRADGRASLFRSEPAPQHRRAEDAQAWPPQDIRGDLKSSRKLEVKNLKET